MSRLDVNTRDKVAQATKEVPCTELISQKEFAIYEGIRKSGVTNMFDVPRVELLSDYKLNKDKIVLIMKHYETLSEFYEEE